MHVKHFTYSRHKLHAAFLFLLMALILSLSLALTSFIVQPHVDFGLKLIGADLMSIPGLHRFVQVHPCIIGNLVW